MGYAVLASFTRPVQFTWRVSSSTSPTPAVVISCKSIYFLRVNPIEDTIYSVLKYYTRVANGLADHSQPSCLRNKQRQLSASSASSASVRRNSRFQGVLSRAQPRLRNDRVGIHADQDCVISLGCRLRGFPYRLYSQRSTMQWPWPSTVHRWLDVYDDQGPVIEW
jgi:hypothetical protein